MYPIWLTLEKASIRFRSRWPMAAKAPNTMEKAPSAMKAWPAAGWPTKTSPIMRITR